MGGNLDWEIETGQSHYPARQARGSMGGNLDWEGRTRFSWLRTGYEQVTKKRNQVAMEQNYPRVVPRGGYEVITPSVTPVTLGTGMYNAVHLQTNCWNHTVESRAAFFRRTRCKARRLIRT